MKRLALAVLAACGGGGATATPATSSGSTAPARTEHVTRGDLGERVVLTGELHAGISVELSSPKTEQWQLTIRWMADDGTVVKQGDRVLEFDNSSFVSTLEAKKLAAREAATSQHTAEDVAAMTLSEKEFEVAQHQIALDKAKLLASVPADLLDQRTAQERKLAELKADSALERARRELAALHETARLDNQVKLIELEKARRAVDSAQKTIDELVMKSPRDGVIAVGIHPWLDRPFQIGDTTQPDMTVVTLPDLTQPMEVSADLSDVDDGRIVLGMIGACTLDAFPTEHLPCKITDLAPVARTKNRTSLRRGFAVKLALEHSDPSRMRPGMSVKVELPLPLVKNVLLVPRGALVLAAKQAQVRLAAGGLRDITLGSCDELRCIASAGVTEGEAVSVGGAL